MRAFFLIFAAWALSVPAFAQSLEHVGSADNGAELYVDRATLRTNRAVAGMRPFDVVQIWVTYDLQGVRRDPARTEKAHYSFDCARKMSNTLAYQRFRANGTRLHDWRAADVDFKYEPVTPGTLPEQAMYFACSGGRMPQPVVQPAPAQSGMAGLVRVDDDAEDADGVAPQGRKP